MSPSKLHPESATAVAEANPVLTESQTQDLTDNSIEELFSCDSDSSIEEILQAIAHPNSKPTSKPTPNISSPTPKTNPTMTLRSSSNHRRSITLKEIDADSETELTKPSKSDQRKMTDYPIKPKAQNITPPPKSPKPNTKHKSYTSKPPQDPPTTMDTDDEITKSPKKRMRGRSQTKTPTPKSKPSPKPKSKPKSKSPSHKLTNAKARSKSPQAPTTTTSPKPNQTNPLKIKLNKTTTNISARPTSPKPTLHKQYSTNNTNSTNQPDQNNHHPTTTNPNHPDNSTQQTNSLPFPNTSYHKYSHAILSRNTSRFRILTPTVNNLQGGTTIDIHNNNKVKFDKFEDFTSNKFFLDRHHDNPTHIIDTARKNTIYDQQAITIQEWYENPHLALISFATGIKDEGLILRTPRCFTDNTNTELKNVITALTRSNGDTTIMDLDIDLTFLDPYESEAPSIEFFAAKGFTSMHDTVPNWLKIPKHTYIPSSLLPAELTTELQAVGSNDVTIITEITMNFLQHKYNILLAEKGHIIWQHLTSDEDPYLGQNPMTMIDTIRLQVMKPYTSFLQLLWLMNQENAPTFPVCFNESQCYNACSWLDRVLVQVLSGKANYNSIFQDPSSLENIDYMAKAFANLPLTGTNPSYINQPYYPITDYNKRNLAKRPQDQVNLTPAQREHQKRSKVIMPRNDEMEQDTFNIEEPPNNFEATHPSDPKHLATIPVRTKNKDGNRSHWTPHRAPTPHPSPHGVDEFPINFEPQDKTQLPPNNNVLNQDQELGPYALQNNRPYSLPPHPNQPHFPHNSRPPARYSIFNQKEDQLTQVLQVISSSYKEQTEALREQVQLQKQLQKDKEKEKISDTVKIIHCNIATEDGSTPAPDITDFDRELLTTKTALEAKDLLESRLKSLGANVVVSMNLAKAVKSGNWPPSSRFALDNLHPSQLSPSSFITGNSDIDTHQAFYDYIHGHDLSRRAQQLLNNPTNVIPKQTYFLIEMIHNTVILNALLTGEESMLSRSTNLWYTFLEENKQLITEHQQNEDRNIIPKLFYVICQSISNYLHKGKTGVPHPCILDSSDIMTQILQGSGYNINIGRAMLEVMNRERNRRNGNSNQPQIVHLPTSQQAQSQSQRVTNPNPNRNLQVSPQVYQLIFAKAIRNNGVQLPSNNGKQECCRFIFRGDCKDDCPRKANHTQLDSTRERRLFGFKNAVAAWHKQHKQPNDPDFP